VSHLAHRLRSKIFQLLSRNPKDQEFLKALIMITGKRPYNIDLYKLAMRHSSKAPVNHHGLKESNERLEYLGDAILGMIVAEYLFARFPFKDEGFLTEVRSKIVNRETLNRLSKKIGLHDLIEFNNQNNTLNPKSIYGDSLEALIGAVYLDKGYYFTQQFVIRRLLYIHYDLDELIHTTSNYKSKIIEWSQKENKDLSFDTSVPEDGKGHKQFTSQVFIDGIPEELGYGSSKKKAEQDAARKTMEKLSIDDV
jgi:ribonuclease-3